MSKESAGRSMPGFWLGVVAVLALVGAAVGALLVLKGEAPANGDRVAFVAGEDTVVTTDLEGEDRREISHTDDEISHGPQITGDGRYLAFETGGADEDLVSRVHVVPADGTGEEQVFEGGNLIAPPQGGSKVFFEAGEGIDPARIMVVDGGSDSPDQVGDASGFLSDATDDGSEVLVYNDTGSGSSYYKINVADGEEEKLDVSPDDLVSDMSPDGRYIFATDDYRGFATRGTLYDLKTGETERMGAHTAGLFSDDSRRLLLGDLWDQASMDMIDLATMDKYSVGEGMTYRTVFVPGSDKMIVVREGDDDQQSQLMLVDPVGNDEKEITRGDAVSVSADGKKIAFRRGEATYSAAIDGSSESEIAGANSPPLIIEVP